MSPNQPNISQGLNLIGRLEPNGYSDANSTSFYSNNTSTISNNLNNSRYTIMNGNAN
jgi:hypothetical protein